MISVGYYFDKKRALATGLSACGSGIGTLVMAPFARYLLEQYGWKRAHFILGIKEYFDIETFVIWSM